MTADPQAGKIPPSRLADPKRAPAKPSRVCVVKEHNVIIGGKPEVAFDAGPDLERRSERSQRIFRNRRAEMKAAVGKTRRPGIERVRA